MAKATLTVSFPDAATKALLTNQEIVINHLAPGYHYTVGAHLTRDIPRGISLYRVDTSATEIRYDIEYYQDQYDEVSNGYLYLTFNHPQLTTLGIPLKIDMAARTVNTNEVNYPTYKKPVTCTFNNGVFTFGWSAGGEGSGIAAQMVNVVYPDGHTDMTTTTTETANIVTNPDSSVTVTTVVGITTVATDDKAVTVNGSFVTEGTITEGAITGDFKVENSDGTTIEVNLPDSITTTTVTGELTSGTPPGDVITTNPDGTTISYNSTNHTVTVTPPPKDPPVISSLSSLSLGGELLNFPDTEVGSTSLATVTLTNTSTTAPLIITNFEIISTVGLDFITRGDIYPITIPAGGSFQLSVSFVPTDNSPRTALLRFKNGEAYYPVEMAFMGNGVLDTVIKQVPLVTFQDVVDALNTGTVGTIQGQGIIYQNFVLKDNHSFLVLDYEFNATSDIDLVYPELLKGVLLSPGEVLSIPIRYNVVSAYALPRIALKGYYF